MAKFIFTKDYTIRVGGVELQCIVAPCPTVGGTVIKQFGKGDVVDLIESPIPDGGNAVMEQIVVDGKRYVIPGDVVEPYTVLKKISQPSFLAFGIIAVIVLFGILKLTKVI